MKLEDVLEILEGKMAWKVDYVGREVSSCYACDLISDILTFEGSDAILLTGLTNAQVIRTAEIMDFVAICFVRGKKPQPETIKQAEAKGLPLFVTKLTMYESCGKLYQKDLPATTKTEARDNCQK